MDRKTYFFQRNPGSILEIKREHHEPGLKRETTVLERQAPVAAKTQITLESLTEMYLSDRKHAYAAGQYGVAVRARYTLEFKQEAVRLVRGRQTISANSPSERRRQISSIMKSLRKWS